MAPTLHMLYASPPARAVMMTAKAIDLELNLKEVDFMNEEHLKPEYMKVSFRVFTPHHFSIALDYNKNFFR